MNKKTSAIMNGTIRKAVLIGILLMAFVIIATPVSATAWSSQSYRFTTSINPASTPAFVYSQSASPNYQYANLNNYLSSGSQAVNKNTFTIPSLSATNNDWDSLFNPAPAFIYSCGCN
jgi:hypothetical protein